MTQTTQQLVDNILERISGTVIDKRHLWDNVVAQWKHMNPTTIPPEFYNALHYQCVCNSTMAIIGGLSESQLQSLQYLHPISNLNRDRIKVRDFANLIADYLYPYDEATDSYGLNESLKTIADAEWYFKQIVSGLLAENKVGYSLDLTDDAFLKAYVVDKIPAVKFAFTSSNNQANTPITVTLTRRLINFGTVSWQRQTSGKWYDIANSDGTSYTPTEAGKYRVKLFGATTSNNCIAPAFYSQSIGIMAAPASLAVSIASINDRINTPITAAVAKTSVAYGYVIEWEIEQRAGRFMNWVAVQPAATGTSYTPTVEGNYRAKITGAVGTDGTNLPVVYSNERYIT